MTLHKIGPGPGTPHLSQHILFLNRPIFHLRNALSYWGGGGVEGEDTTYLVNGGKRHRANNSVGSLYLQST